MKMGGGDHPAGGHIKGKDDKAGESSDWFWFSVALCVVTIMKC